MIKLDTTYVLTTQTIVGGQVTDTTTMDTLFVSQFSPDFTTGITYATIQRGTLDSNNNFIQTQDIEQITINPDGTFTNSDGSYTGTLTGMSDLISSLKTQLDQFILDSGLVTGTIE